MRQCFIGITLLFVVTMSLPVQAADQRSEPISFQHAINWKSSSSLRFDALDMRKVNAVDNARVNLSAPKRIGVSHKESHDRQFEQKGQWGEIDQTSVWRLKITAADARWLSFGFDNVFLPPGASLFIFNEGRDQVLGPFTDKDNKLSKELWTPTIDGDIAYIEMSVPTAMKSLLTFDLKTINHGYKNFKESGNGGAGACNIDVACAQGDNWRDEIRSVAMYTFNREQGAFVCTGNLINNHRVDRRPYFLTANHCVATATEAQSMVIYWNFEKSVCGGSSDGSLAQTQSGATLRATIGSIRGQSSSRDMTLVELDARPNEAFNAHWTGWDASTDIPTSGVGIHHPNSSEKRISIDSGSIFSTDYNSFLSVVNGTHLRIDAWEQGTTEGGSSGSGFWNSEQRLVGVLSGGRASCSVQDGSDWYAHLAANYDYGMSSSANLKAWLDPDNTGITQLDGVDDCSAPPVTITISSNPVEANQVTQFAATVGGSNSFNGTFEWDFNNDGVIDSTVQSPQFIYSDTFIGNVSVTVVSASSCSTRASAAMVVFPEGGNSVPTANAVATRTSVDEGETVQLSGATSSDPDGDVLTYRWVQTAGEVAEIVSPESTETAINLPLTTRDTILTFELTVTDIFGATGKDSVDLAVFDTNSSSAPIIPVSPASTGGGGATGLFTLLLLVFASINRFFVHTRLVLIRRVLISMSGLTSLVLVSACSTSTRVESTPVEAAQAVAHTALVTTTLERKVVLRRVDTTGVTHIFQAKQVDAILLSLDRKQRRYEKIKPLYDYEIQVTVDGESQVWQVSQGGYIQKATSPELFKMDVSVLKDRMK